MTAYREDDDEGRPANPSGDADALLIHELSEALTALGNYLTATVYILQGKAAREKHSLDEALTKGLGQYERASRAFRNLYAHRQTAGDEERIAWRSRTSCDGG